MLPRLRRANLEDDTHAAWVVVAPFLGGRGLDGLALSLVQAFRDAGQLRDLAAVRDRLASASDLRALGNDLLDAQSAPEGSVLLVLDQLEEMSGKPTGLAARAMLRLLLEASAGDGSPFVVLATMRSDFLNAFQLFEGAAERYEKITLDPMPRSRFAAVIEGPADRFGLDLDAGLSERMAEETAYNDALPLLAFTLETLYERCKRQRRLTLKTYQELGGVSAAIEHAADAILEETGYVGLPADDSRMRDLRRAFYSLAQVGEEGQFARRVARWSQIPASGEAILKRFVDQRLLVSDIANGEPVLSVAHEALFRVWDTLGGWLGQDRKALVLRGQIEDAATAWQTARVTSHAWPEERILDAVRQMEDSGISLAEVADRATVNAFLGPTDPNTLEALPSLTAAEDATAGSGRYGQTWRPPLDHAARASTGVRLALLGDRRKGVGLRADGSPDIDWRRIEAGEVMIEIRSNPDPNSPVVKRLARTVEWFWMARYPVTIVQFQAFLNECYRDGAWRLPPGFAVKLSTTYPPAKPRGRYDNHPVDGLNWFDSMAFCHWLSACLGFEVRLPTEFEWQLAATGGDPARAYPWGAEWDAQAEPWRANTFENELGRPTAVGMYPAGASPAGIEDMAGTVWEWCQNAFDNPDNDGFPQSPEDHRVLRGGSWACFQFLARSAFRLGSSQANRDGDLGFRVVSSSPS